MKIAVRKIGPLGSLYNDKYDQNYYDELWKECLLDKLEPGDEVTWMTRMPTDKEGFDIVLDDYDAVIGAWIFDNMITEEMLSKHPNIKYIGTISHGYSEFDKNACKKHGVTVTNTHFNDYAVAQHTMALLLEITTNIGENSLYYKKGKWGEKNNCNKLFTRQMELENLTFGIIGLGSIGYLTAKMANGFGMKVQSYSRHTKQGEKYAFINQVDMKTLLQTSDIISIHCPATLETKDLINSATLDMMKSGVIILNCSRGDVINEEDLLNSLNSGKVYAAGLDVLKGEPLKVPNSLLEHPRVFATEHIAWATPEARIRSVTVACDNFLNWRKGTPISVIS